MCIRPGEIRISPGGLHCGGPSLYKSSIINTYNKISFLYSCTFECVPVLHISKRTKTDTQTKKPSEAEEKIKLCFEIMSDDKNNNA